MEAAAATKKKTIDAKRKHTQKTEENLSLTKRNDEGEF